MNTIGSSVKTFIDPATASLSHVVTAPGPNGHRHCAIIDPVLNYEPVSGQISTRSADRLIAYIESAGLSVTWLLETQVHNQLSAATYLKSKLGGQIGISAQSAQAQADSQPFDHSFADNERFAIGRLEAVAWFTPGHSPTGMSYIMGDAAFIGDTLLMPDVGTGRCDLPSGDAHALYRSIQRIFTLPASTRLYMSHDDTAPGGPEDEYVWFTTVGEQQRRNIHIHTGITEDDFVSFRDECDARLAPPHLLPAVQLPNYAGA